MYSREPCPTTAVPAPAVKLPAWALAKVRTAAWNPKRREGSGSWMRTVTRWLFPGWYMGPPANSRLTPPPAGLRVAVWQDPQGGFDSPGTPALPAGTRLA